MILDEFIVIKKPNGISYKYYKDLGYDLLSEEIYVKIEHLSKSSSRLVNVKCDYCGDFKEVKFCDYNKITKDGKESYACKNCSKIKYQKTCLEKYGVDNYFKSDKFKNDLKNHNLEKYGVEYHTQSEIVKYKIKNIVQEKYDVDNISKLNIIKDKVKNTNFNKYGHWNSRINYKIDNDENHIMYIGGSLHLFKCDKNHDFEISNSNYYGRIRSNTPLCTICYPISVNRSIKENEIFEFIQSIYSGEVVKSYRNKLEIDIFLPELKLGFEFNGIHWHSDKFTDKNYHYKKSRYFEELGIRIFHIWEDDWIQKKDIVRSMISNKIKSTPIHLFARKCDVRLISDEKLVKDFLNSNHIQGYVKSDYKVGLFYNCELVGLMTFDKFEGRKKMSENEWNLNRFCNKLNINIVGGASKLLNYFIKNIKPSRIISYADVDWSYGDLYLKLGFLLVKKSRPDYKYVIKEKRVHKSRFRKSITGVSESNLDVPKIWDCGKLKFELIL